MKTLSILIFTVCYVSILSSFFYSFHLARQEHRITLKDVKNEVPNGYLIRTLLSLIYYFCIVDWIAGLNLVSWAYIRESVAMNISGIVVALITTCLFWWITISLGPNYHGPMKLHADHKLVTKGPYRFVRHPTYVAFPLSHIGFFLITGNYILLLAGLIMSIYTNHHRIKIEENLLTEKFGLEYEDYSTRTGRYIPILIRKNGM